MYIDSFTVSALVVFVIMLAVFVHFCRVKVCGMAAMRGREMQDRQDKPQGRDPT